MLSREAPLRALRHMHRCRSGNHARVALRSRPHWQDDFVFEFGRKTHGLAHPGMGLESAWWPPEISSCCSGMMVASLPSARTAELLRSPYGAGGAMGCERPEDRGWFSTPSARIMAARALACRGVPSQVCANASISSGLDRTLSHETPLVAECTYTHILLRSLERADARPAITRLTCDWLTPSAAAISFCLIP